MSSDTFLDENELEILNNQVEEVKINYEGELSENQIEYIRGRLKQTLENAKFRSMI